MSDVIEKRKTLLGRHVTTFYDDPLHVVRGQGAWLWDKDGRRYLDCYNNVPHVGHCHPKVVAAISEQAATLNTHTRYVHDAILEYGAALTGTLGSWLDSLLMTCSGSEANDVALRMAQAATGNTGFIGTDNTYHGNTAAVSQLNASKVPVGGYADHVRQVPAPDTMLPIGGDAAGQADAFADGVRRAIAELDTAGHGVAALILCPYFANEGFPTLERGFLDQAIAAVRAAGGVIIADEVQPGFGRLGSHFWGHQRLGFAPEIVTMGKPMGNGHPVAAVVTSPDILTNFQEAFRYFNTFGGNPVSVAAAMATLQVVQDEGIMDNARDVGAYTLGLLGEVQARHPVIGDVRGAGLFLGAELWRDGAPASDLCARVVEEMRTRGVLVHSVGRHNNTVKIRPPCVFSKANADLLAATLDDALDAIT